MLTCRACRNLNHLHSPKVFLVVTAVLVVFNVDGDEPMNGSMKRGQTSARRRNGSILIDDQRGTGTTEEKSLLVMVVVEELNTRE